MTQEQTALSVERVKKAIEEMNPAGKDFDSFSVSEEAKNFLDGGTPQAGGNKENAEIIEYTRLYQDDKIAGSKDPFWKNTGSQYLVFSEKLYHSGFFDSMTDEEAGEAEAVLRAITQGMDSLSNAWYMTGRGASGVSGKGYTLPTSYEAKMELESSTAALMYFEDKYLEDEGLRNEFEGLVQDYHAHNTEVLDEFVNPMEQMDKAVSRFYSNPQSLLNRDLFGRAASQNPGGVSYSRYMGSVTHTEGEEQQYERELAGIFIQLKQNPSQLAGIWKKLQDTMLNYATNHGGSQAIRNQVLAGAGDSFRRMENCWSLLLKG